MNLDEFKKAVEIRLLELSPNDSGEWIKYCRTLTNSTWEEYFQDFSDKGIMTQSGVNAVAGGMIGGLI